MTESLEFEWVLRPDSHPGIEHYVLHFRGEARAWDDDAGEEVLVGRIVGHRVEVGDDQRGDVVGSAVFLTSQQNHRRPCCVGTSKQLTKVGV